MENTLYKVNVSSLNIRKDPKIQSRIFLTRDTILRKIGDSKQYKGSRWLLVETVDKPIARGYVQLKYISVI